MILSVKNGLKADEKLERVELCGINFVQIQSILLKALACRHSVLRQKSATKSRRLWLEPFGQHICTISTVLSLFYVE